jgi:hypothetical protein
VARSSSDRPAEPLGPREWTERLAACRRPFIIGVRHHSPVVSVAVPHLLTAFAPDVVLVELPPDLASWLPWLGHPDLVAPVALAAVGKGQGAPLAFYPYADFSPELVAIRWSVRHGVTVDACDAPLSVRLPPEVDRQSTVDEPSLVDVMRFRLSGRSDDDVWDRLVEAPAPGSAPESVRRAALSAGWAMRTDEQRRGGIDAYHLRREAWMRAAVTAASAGGRRVAAVVGAFHAPALLEPDEGVAAAPKGSQIVTSLVPYPFPLLDSRSGYPAGIRDPQWQQGIYEAGADPAQVRHLAAAAAVRITVALRAAGHAAGPAESAEAARLADDLARLRGLPAPGRGELVEAIQSVLAQGQLQGRGRSVAEAMREVLIGHRYGRLPAGAPRSGLLPAVMDELARLRLPGPGDEGRTVRLDPLRSPLDRRREVALCRLVVCEVPYGERLEVTGVGAGEALTTSWWLAWQPATEAMLGVAGLRGVTLAQAAEGTLRLRRDSERASGGPTPAAAVAGLLAAAECGFAGLVAERVVDVEAAVVTAGSLTEILEAIVVVERLARGHLPGLPESTVELKPLLADLDGAAVREVDGLTGSDRLEDARALLALAERGREAGRSLRLQAALHRLTVHGTPVMQGAAGAVLTVIGVRSVAEFGEILSSFVDSGGDRLRGWLSGSLIAAGPLLAAGQGAVAALLDRIEALTDGDFMRRLPALRGGFDTMSPAGRERLLTAIEDRTAQRLDDSSLSPELLNQWLHRDAAGRAAVDGLGLLDAGWIPATDRWRLVLGRRSDQLAPPSQRTARALDELYGAGRGEGSRTVGGTLGGRDAPYPSVREWSTELTELFGEQVCTEVLAAAAERGRLDAALAVDPGAVRASVELLHTMLSLAGGLPEARLARLRPLIARLVSELAKALAAQMRPALTGITTPYPTRRRTGALDLAATVRANLRTVRRDAAGRPVIVPDRPLFRGRAARSVDWRLIIVVDVSGSMEASTIWAAMTAAILAGVPALTTHFVTFSTVVADLTDLVDDPLALLLEVTVGGGTHIAAGLRYAHSLVTIPTRTLIAVISDFEEGYPIGDLLGEVRAIVESGCHLLGCASLDDQSRPRYSVGAAEQLVAAGMPVAALSPVALARWVAERVR